MAFSAQIVVDNINALIYVNDKVSVSSEITYGPLLLSTLQSSGMVICSANNAVILADILPVYANYSITSITKQTWQTEDGYFYNGDNFSHIFRAAGDQQITTTVWSNEMLYNGIPFTFQFTTYQVINLTSYFLKFMTTRLPMLARNQNQEMIDLLTAGANFFDVMYTKVRDIYTLIDIEKIDPTFFEELSLTFGHLDQYAKKVAGDATNASFDTYDIFDMIKNGTATSDQIRKFRYFLLYSTQLFKTGGTPDNITKFLSFFNIDGYTVDLWTETWGLTPVGITSDDFSGYCDFAKNALGLIWNDLLVIGNDNDDGHFVKNFNTITIDNYHTSQKLEFDNDIIGYDPITGWAQFPILYNAPIFIEVRNENGQELVPTDQVQEWYDIVPNTDPNTNTTSPWLLDINPFFLTPGMRLSVLYQVSNENTVIDSMVSNPTLQVQNCDICVKFKIDDIPYNYKQTNLSLPEYDTFVVFRGALNLVNNTNENTVYNNFNEYYRVDVDARRSTVSLCKVVQDPDTLGLVTQQINLNVGSDTKIYDVGIVPCSGADLYQFKTNNLYELKVQIAGSTVSAYFRDAIEDNIIQTKIDGDEGNIQWGNPPCNNWITLFQNINIDVPDSEVLSTDVDGDTIPSYPYTPLLNAGYYGVGGRNTVLEIKELTIDNLDPDNTYYSTDQKELTIKPKYQEWANQNLIQYNNYPMGEESAFSYTIAPNFNAQTTTYQLDPNVVNSFKSFYFDNANVTEEIASRYTVIFNQEWVESTFENAQDLMNKIIVPIGSQPAWFSVESRIYDVDFYGNYYGETTTNHNFGTETNPNVMNAPGFFSYNLSTPLGLYKTEPLDEFSSLVRTDNYNATTDAFINTTFTFGKRIQQYKLSNNSFLINGLFEEVCPNSNIFSNAEICGNLDENGIALANPLFFPVVVQDPGNQRVVGVRFKNCSDINDIITRITGAATSQAQVLLYGSYIVQLPIQAVQFRPDLTYALEILESNPSTVVVKMFVPLGILNSQIQNYSLSTEYLHQIENSGGTSIVLDGVYILVPRALTIYMDSANQIQLTSPNAYENLSTGLLARYYLSAQLQLATNLNDYENINTANQIPYKYMMNYDFRKLLSNLKANGGNYGDDYLWWLPREIWRKRDFVVQSLDPQNDVASGINYDPNKDITKIFYGNDFNPSDINQHSSLQIKLTDGPITPYTLYYAKVQFKMSYNGYDELYLGNASPIDGTTQSSRPLTGTEAAEVITVGGEATKYPNSTLSAPVAQCLDFYVPIAWYPESDIPTNNNLAWGNYIKGVVGDDNAPTVSLTPYGLMTWLLAHATDADANIQNINQITQGWTIQDWNQRFLTFVNIQYIAEKVPAANYSLYDEFGFLSKYATTSGTEVSVNYDAGEMPWVVEDTAILSSYGFSSYYFALPIEVYRLVNWFEDVQSITADSLVINQNLYTLADNTLTLNADNLFNTIGSEAQFNALLSFELYNDFTNTETLVDNFNDINQLSWINYEENTTPDIYELAVRAPSSNLFLSGSDPAFTTTTYQNQIVYQKVQGKSTNTFNPMTNGAGTTTPIVKKNDNAGFTKTISLINNKNSVYEITANVIFDPALNLIKNYDGKKFELILNAEVGFSGTTNDFILTSYYFVGIKTYNFTIALGVAKFNPTTGLMEKTILAGYGNYNGRDIVANQYYTLGAQVDGNYLRVSFNNMGEDKQTVINYNINSRNAGDPNRYLTGGFEELCYLVTGLSNLGITYPDNLASITGTTVYNQIWDEQWAINFKPVGQYSGIKVFNNLTYLGEVSLTGSVQDAYTYTNAYDTTNWNAVILEIQNTYGPTGNITNIGKTTNGTLVVLYGNTVFYKSGDNITKQYISDVSQMFVVGEFIVVEFLPDNDLVLGVIDQFFSNIQAIYIKDNSFNSDNLYRYQEYTGRSISGVFCNNQKLYLTFENSPLPFSLTSFRINEAADSFLITEDQQSYRVIEL
jgi:hypothetical protein